MSMGRDHVIFFGALFLILLFFVVGKSMRSPDVELIATRAEATYRCHEDKTIHATFFSDDTVSLDLSDGRVLLLPQVLSGSGARFANKNETFVFWNKGTGAFITENGTQTFSDCER